MTKTLHQEQHYFIDESGDATLFDSRGRCIVGSGASKCFILGAALIVNPAGLQTELDFLRLQLIADPYFKGVPSFDVTRNKTANYFHAKNDLPEVRREVFRVIREHDVRVVAAIRRKDALAISASRRFEETGRKISETEIYDSLVEQIMHDRLHIAEHSHIWFARRGKRERKEALTAVIEKARARFTTNHMEAVMARLGDRQPKTSIYSAKPSEVAGLQVVDYCLWALQRHLEKGEGRYFDYISTKFRAIWDTDDVSRSKPGGGCHRGKQRKPISSSKILPVAS
jgi:hypothetical protein